jgi:hypothetical protein
VEIAAFDGDLSLVDGAWFFSPLAPIFLMLAFSSTDELSFYTVSRGSGRLRATGVEFKMVCRRCTSPLSTKIVLFAKTLKPLSSYSLDRLQERFKNDRHQIECNISYKTIEVRSLIDDAIGHSTKSLNLERDPDRPQIIVCCYSRTI